MVPPSYHGQPKVDSAADLAVAVSGAPNPVTVSSNITYSIRVSNFGPSTAANVVVTNKLPAGTAFVPAASSPAVDTSVPGLLIYRLGSMPKDAFADLTVTALTTVTNVTVTNLVWAASDTPDFNPLNNTNLVATTITNFASDLNLRLAVAPDPVFLGDTLTYTITVSNAGPVDGPELGGHQLPARSGELPRRLPRRWRALRPQSQSRGVPGSWRAPGRCHLHPYGHRSRVSLSPPMATSGIPPPPPPPLSTLSKSNNSDTVKALVLSLPISVAHAGPNAITLSWPAAAPNCVLQSTANLNPPVQWTPVTNPLPSLDGDHYTITLGTTNGTRFFRLGTSAP